ncbi:MBL fold metallo-hydrolase [Actinoplanes derwentensis]|uniref:Cyclase n=1 Tax=Actinoplanes derwentensis TaxID=113562 RepID=A0A1H1ZPK6_9ACTN|nr:MBL fold metallo-hydrolase [Actinoplanes derwentensis]GID89148.1 MBL fold metallo-hydrolase [Actinoplanes derwentensis]SDT35600.1 cyclase [Actinoplanes derwentensis]
MTWDDGNPYVDRLTEGVHAYVQPDGGWMVNNCGVIADAAGTAILVDTTSTERRNRAMLASLHAAPLAVVNTHHHPDHTYGNGFLPAQTLVIGHEKCRDEVLAAGLEATKVITAPDYGNLVLRPPNLTFNDTMTLHLADFPVALQHVGRAHTSNDVVVWLPEQRVLFAGDLAFAGGQPFLLEGSVAGFRAAIAHMRALAPEVLVPGHGPVCRGDEVGKLLDGLDAYVAFVADVAASAYQQGLSPLEAAVKHRDNPYQGWAETERFVGNLHRAYSELAGNPADHRLTVASVWPDMVAFHGGPIACHA